MEESPLIIALVGGGIVLLALVVIGVLMARCYHKAAPGQALLVSGSRPQPRVSFRGALVIPVLERVDVIDLTVKPLVLERRGTYGLRCRDGVRADVVATFHVHVGRTVDDIVKVATSIGAERAVQPETLEQLFTARFSEALKAVAARRTFAELVADREAFRDEVLEAIGKDLNGYHVDQLAVDELAEASAG